MSNPIFMSGSIKLGKSRSLKQIIAEKIATSSGTVKTAQSSMPLESAPSDLPSTGVQHSSQGMGENLDLPVEGEQKDCVCPCACSDQGAQPKEGDVHDDQVLPESSDVHSDVHSDISSDVPSSVQPSAPQHALASSKNFVKIAKLNKASKDLIRAQFEAIYPKEFVDAMLAEY